MLRATRCADPRSADASTMRSLNVPSRPVAVSHDRRQPLALRRIDNDAYRFLITHDPQPI
jgi:hypothetical protein